MEIIFAMVLGAFMALIGCSVAEVLHRKAMLKRQKLADMRRVVQELPKKITEAEHYRKLLSDALRSNVDLAQRNERLERHLAKLISQKVMKQQSKVLKKLGGK